MQWQTNWLQPNPFEGNPKIIEQPDSSYNISLTSDNRWKDFIYGYDVPKRVRDSDFDYLDDAEDTDGYFKYKGTWHHLSQFERVPPGTEFAKLGWGGVLHYSMSNGLVLKVSDDGEQYQVGYYYLTSQGK